MDHMLDNVGSRTNGPTLLMALISGRPEHSPEAEPVLVERRGGSVVLTLDDASEVAFDLVELQQAIAGMTAPVVLRSAA